MFDLTAGSDEHPGGAQSILDMCATDGTSAFEEQHSGEGRPERELVECRIGALE